jgi:ubiquitin-protein ligase
VMQEIGTMSTSLPIQRDSSVFLVVDENKSHCMRALITGPKDTPYQVIVAFDVLQFADTYCACCLCQYMLCVLTASAVVT